MDGIYMKFRELIATYCDSTTNKGNGLLIHAGTVEEGKELEMPPEFIYKEEWSSSPSRRIWLSNSYQTIIVREGSALTMHEHSRKASYRIHLLDLQEEYEEHEDYVDLAQAFTYVYNAHANNFRKGTEIPYIVHPMDVASILMKNGASKMLTAAGLMHDLVEDTDVGLVEINNFYGSRIAELVKAVSELDESDQPYPTDGKARSWKVRKEHSINTIKAAGWEVKLLSCADKLANIRDMISDRNNDAEYMWERYNADKDEQEWYYSSMLEAYCEGDDSIVNTQIYADCRKCVDELFG